MKIVVFGASGSGTSTVGKSLALALNALHLDAFYWKKTPVPNIE